jgi:hypothetical protein
MTVPERIHPAGCGRRPVRPGCVGRPGARGGGRAAPARMTDAATHSTCAANVPEEHVTVPCPTLLSGEERGRMGQVNLAHVGTAPAAQVDRVAPRSNRDAGNRGRLRKTPEDR